jgi:hypothetical protein
MKYRIQVNVLTDRDEDTWTGNSLLYPTDTDALTAAVNLSERWLLVRFYRVVDENNMVWHTNKQPKGPVAND